MNCESMVYLFVGCTVTALLGACSSIESKAPLDAFVDASKKGSPYSAVTSLPRPAANDCKRYIVAHPDETSYHALMFLRMNYPLFCDGIPKEVRGKVLCKYMSHAVFLNDFGNPETGVDRIAGFELKLVGKEALPLLQLILNDKREAPLEGSEEATIASIHEFRRCDYAFRYIMLIIGRPTSFPAAADERDSHIESLKKELNEKN